MKTFTLREIRDKYDEYKGILEAIENHDYEVMERVSVEDYQMMLEIVDTLEDMGFDKVIKPYGKVN